MRRACIFLIAVVSGAAVGVTAASAQLRTGITDDRFNDGTPGPAMRLTKTTGAKIARFVFSWHNIAFNRPAVATDPNDPAYNWAHADKQVQAAANNGLQPLVTIVKAPPWAHHPNKRNPEVTRYPNAPAYGDFAEAAAKRYNGTFIPPGATEPLPRVRWWMAWNEPNRKYFLLPQFVGTKVESAVIYRRLVNEFAEGVRAGDPDGRNLVVAGGLAPLGVTGSPAPIRFMRQLFKSKVSFDVWSHHPYTSGGPRHKAAGSGNIALGNLPRMRKLLYANVRAGQVDTKKKVQFWVTEFSWDTKPPDRHRYALPMGLHARWTAEALYRMWKKGVSVVIWFKVRDNPFRTSPYQSGFYTAKGARKRSLRAFRFPTVAFRKPGRIRIWGRTPTSAAGKVVIQIRIGKRWRTLTRLRANGNGIFQSSVKTPYRSGLIRARHRTETSLGFSLTPVPDRYVNPFGCGGGLPCQ